MRISHVKRYMCAAAAVAVGVCVSAVAAPAGNSADSSAALSAFNVVPGAAVVTNGWADVGSMHYPDGRNIIVISDATYKTAESKCAAFTNAIASGSASSAETNDASAIIILDGTVDLSGGKVSDKDHSYFDAFYGADGTCTENGKVLKGTPYARVHLDIVYPIGSNKTIIGTNKARIAFGGLRIKASVKKPVHDIIIRNVQFWDAHGSTEFDTNVAEFKDKKASIDQLSIEGDADNKTGKMNASPSNIWIDHCSFTDGTCSDLKRNFNHDGALDAKAVHNMTVSYCDFTNHDKVTLLAPGDLFVTPEDRQITFHHNYYHGTVQRMPRTRGCQVHMYNNAYDTIGTQGNSGYCMSPGIGAQFIVENNFFGKTLSPWLILSADSSKSGDATLYHLYTAGNVPELNDKNVADWQLHHVDSMPWTISYTYTLDKADNLLKTLPGLAGSR